MIITVGLVSDDVEKKLSTYNVPEGYTVEMGGRKGING